MISFSIFFFFLVQSSFANFEDSYAENSDTYDLNSEEFLDPDEGDINKRDNHFMRFGRNGFDHKNEEYLYDEYDDPYIKAKRSGNHHVRLGRSGPNAFMRLGRGPSKSGRNKSLYMRIGRDLQDQDNKIRSKRSALQNRQDIPDTDYPKRKDHFMRFGKSPSFMRYGRNPTESKGFPDNSEKIEAILDRLQPASLNLNENYLKENHPLSMLAKILTRRQEILKSFDDSI